MRDLNERAKPRRKCLLCSGVTRLLRRVGRPNDPDFAIAICLVCDGPAALVRPHPGDRPSPRQP